ncbi:voltage-gated sodium channel [Alteromonadaceae bacterium 2753L.S.0a.02]|nr:voltage-gated sodium channel [Alteromonadaceae bacterium 2753L.S.0a.02]
MQADALNLRFQKIKSNKFFEIFVISIIVFSAIVVGAKTYDIPPVIQQVVTIIDWLITVVFIVEITIRFLAEENKNRFFRSAWNIFDTTIVLVSVIPIENSEMAVIGRLVRIFRVLRMVSIVPELRVLIVSLLKALPQLGYVMLLMFIIYYIYAAIGSTFFEEINPKLWGDVAISMLTLFRVMTFEDWTDVMYETMEVYALSWIYFLSFIFFTAFAFLNMVIGIVVNVMEKEHQTLVESELSKEANELSSIRAEIAELKTLLLEQRQISSSAQ